MQVYSKYMSKYKIYQNIYQSLEIDDILQHKTQSSTVFNAVFSIQRSLQQHTTQPSAYNAVFNSIQLSLQHTTQSSIGFQQSRFTKRRTPATYKSFQTSSSIDTIYQSEILTLQALYISQLYHSIKCMPVLSNRAC